MTKANDIHIEGGRPLAGNVKASGAKNSVLKLMAASILASGPTCIENVPSISDVRVMGEVLSELGAGVQHGASDVKLDTSTISNLVAPPHLVNQMRASIAVLGPLIGRFHQAQVAIPGGCRIGERPLDMHYSALEALGAEFSWDQEFIYARAPHGLRGARVDLGFASVGATENLMMAAVLAEGVTQIGNAACEPEIADLASYLNAAGARIHGAGSPNIVVEGVRELIPVASHQTIGDRIEAGTFLMAGALMGGPVTVEGIDHTHLATVLMKLKAMGADVEAGEGYVSVGRRQRLQATAIQTLPFPGFPTDLQAPAFVLACLAKGRSTVAENIYEDRFQHVSELALMGAEIVVEGRLAYIDGVGQLHGATVEAKDLRGGAALVLAGLAAEGHTVVTEAEYIDRGYQELTRKLQSLGADTWRG
jgi:UDP-N-acetylglucosamine 1-carboxyvinyltransferase